MNSEERFSFPIDGKESIQERIKQLVGDRSLRKASQAWGLPYSTLNNYFEKNTTPGLHVVATIAKVENVSLEWLVYGEGRTTNEQKTADHSHTQSTSFNENDLVNELFRRANQDDREKLINALCDIGIKGVLSKLQQPEAQHSQPEREYTKEELEAMIRALPVREAVKDAASMVLAMGESADREILQLVEHYRRAELPESESDNTPTPDSSLKQKAG
ncbi:bacteriophage CI repressor [Salmonella enterica subsp. enterica serovar Rubislaw]|nr:bacteriophage CI repressor [Salmonella enterica subsp. enterica serovar Rubislaw]